MNKLNNLYFIIIIIKTILSDNLCIDNKNYCKKCHPLTNKCIKCISENFIINSDGGCTGKCSSGKNYCNECDEEEKICRECQSNFYPDKVGGCSIVPNCKASYMGKCIECEDNYILIGEEIGFKICKNRNSFDFKNCKVINNVSGLCKECENGFYLNQGDFKCIQTENCKESIFGICISCIEGYYLNKKNGKCDQASNKFFYCKQTVDEINCDICNENYYLAEDGQCSDTVLCSKTEKGKCIECVSGANLINDNACTLEERCNKADKDTGLCNSCISGYYIDNKDKKCKSNKKENEYKYCTVAYDGCRQCKEGFYLGEDLQCTKTEKCAESENNICNKCSKGYYIGLDHKCTKVEHCIYSGSTDEYICDECEDNYYYNNINQTCVETIEEKFKNCKIAITDGEYCSECKNNFYLNLTDFLCYDNTKYGDFYKCSMTNSNGTECVSCENGYYFGRGNNKCSNITRCKYSENGIKCLACDECFCLDLKKGLCFDNDFLREENEKLYINCNMTNKEGTACEQCLDGYIVGEEGYCIDNTRCEEKVDGICVKCKNDPSDYMFYCANKYFGCIHTFINACIKCDNIFDLYSCTECEEGYKINQYGLCQKI